MFQKYKPNTANSQVKFPNSPIFDDLPFHIIPFKINNVWIFERFW